MTLNATGPISLAGTTAGQSIEIELGGTGTTQISLNCTSVRTLAGVPSGAIIMPTNFYGKSNQFTYTVSANQTNFCMRAGAISAGWDGTSKLVVNINSGVIISSNGTGTPALRIQGAYAGGVTVNNSGTIVGMGGAAGAGSGNYNITAGSGAGAGTALKVCSSTTFNNIGTIAGGGGGGGGGGGSNLNFAGMGGGGGGGGRSSNAANASGGAGGSGSGGGASGTAGTYASPGTGGCGASGCAGCCGNANGGTGGNGGGWGSSGGAGGAGRYNSIYYGNGGGGGAGGKATCGAGTYITWTGTGTRYGSIS